MSAAEGGAAIALFAHPDDEIGLFPWVDRARRLGRRVYCVWLTDGGWGGQSIERRCEESRRVLESLDVAVEDMLFAGAELGIPDGGLHHRIDQAMGWLAARFAAMPAGTPLWIPAWEGGHPDHDAAHLAGHELARALCVEPRQYSLYHGKGLPGPWFRVLSPIEENGPCESVAVGFAERLRCVGHCLRYRSQWKSFVGLLPFYSLAMLKPQPFVLQTADWRRTAERPHAGPLLYERRGGPSWDEFARITAPYRCAD